MTNTGYDPYQFTHRFADFDRYSKHFVGVDKFFTKLQETADLVANSAAAAGYPPYNIKKTGDNVYVIEMAVAGFGKQDIELTLEDNKLKIKGQTTVDTLVADGVDTAFLHKGISDRPFTRTFTLADDVVINNAKMVNGMLKVWLEHIVPEEKKPRKIDIEDGEQSEDKPIKKK